MFKTEIIFYMQNNNQLIYLISGLFYILHQVFVFVIQGIS